MPLQAKRPFGIKPGYTRHELTNIHSRHFRAWCKACNATVALQRHTMCCSGTPLKHPLRHTLHSKDGDGRAVCVWCGPVTLVTNGPRTLRCPNAVEGYKSSSGHGLSNQQARRRCKEAGQCEVCGSTHRLCVDHNHVTGKIRGVLCSHCNSALGLINDNLDTLQGLINYLKEKDNGQA